METSSAVLHCRFMESTSKAFLKVIFNRKWATESIFVGQTFLISTKVET